MAVLVQRVRQDAQLLVLVARMVCLPQRRLQ
jgi:hypothetical protein